MRVSWPTQVCSAGAIGWRRSVGAVTIESVRIASDLRGGGLGTLLMNDALGRARSRGCFMVQLTTDLRREHTRRYYERLGFVASHHGMKHTLK